MTAPQREALRERLATTIEPRRYDSASLQADRLLDALKAMRSEDSVCDECRNAVCIPCSICWAKMVTAFVEHLEGK